MPNTPEKSTATVPAVNDACPRSAVEIIARICELEIRLGNIRQATGDNGKADWHVAQLPDLLRRTSDADDAEDASAVDSLFHQVCRLLTAEGHEAATIAKFVNARIPSGKLPYCSADEVLAVLAGE